MLTFSSFRIICLRSVSVSPKNLIHTSPISYGIEEFFDPKKNKPSDIMITGRSWTASDLRRKSFDDLHKLWYVLYKERNLLLTSREKGRRSQRFVLPADEYRYTKVKRSMAAIKLVLGERKKIDLLLKSSSLQTPSTPS